MAAFTLSASSTVVAKTSFKAQNSKISQAKFGCSIKGLAGAKPLALKKAAVTSMSAAASEDVPDMGKRTVMNLLLVGALGLPGTSLLGSYAYFFVPPSAGGGGGGSPAKDANGNEVKIAPWLETHQAGDRSLTQGLKGDATYLVVKDDGSSIENYGVNAVCTHLGCVVPWNAAENKFMCPCHGSQYNFQGKVVRGPAPLSLALAHADISETDVVVFSTWTETDFRTGLDPWWS
ncbi:hypothetical protein CYMTET_46932 [Cymbomonas tetramitiformis]|uniref:plastoquinol--plastocyanin reductase n=1 Tax=Cymbomonas tetramitiformis TaxID=36881 RepID=A0AAE0EX33_9CHLO|nr:hypothetical protein CYMTET_46932 [Cymbomonas tetramitiformis]|eukprot:gene11192-13227_t